MIQIISYLKHVQSSHSISNMATAASFYSFFKFYLGVQMSPKEREESRREVNFLLLFFFVNVIYKANETNLCIQCMYIVKYVRLLYL